VFTRQDRATIWAVAAAVVVGGCTAALIAAAPDSGTIVSVLGGSGSCWRPWSLGVARWWGQ